MRCTVQLRHISSQVAIFLNRGEKDHLIHGEILNIDLRVRSIPQGRLDLIGRNIRTLYKMRLDADYYPKKTVDARMANHSLVLCRSVLKELERYE